MLIGLVLGRAVVQSMVVLGLWARVRFGLERGLVRGVDGVIWFGLVRGAMNGFGYSVVWCGEVWTV